MTTEDPSAGPAGPRPSVERSELERLEWAVRDALVRGDEGGLHVLGYGEISLVLGWPVDRPRWACKRLPPFDDEAQRARYRRTFERYVAALTERGIRVHPSTFVELDLAADGQRGDRRPVAYVVQQALAPDDLGPTVLGRRDPDPESPFLEAILDAICRTADDRVGIDGQVSNWARSGAEVTYLDVTTPLLRDARGRPQLDLGPLLAAQPWALRGLVRRFVAPEVLARFHDPRHVLLDLAGNLLKERLDGWLGAVVEAANRRVRPAIDEEEVRAFYRNDARTWRLMLALRRLDRVWQQRVRRRPYPFLLPGPIDR